MDARERVKAAEARVQAAAAELTAAKDELHEARVAASPYRVGQILTREATSGIGRAKKTFTERAQVTRFYVHWGETAVELTMFKNDGTLGKRARTLYGWGNWQLEAQP